MTDFLFDVDGKINVKALQRLSGCESFEPTELDIYRKNRIEIQKQICVMRAVREGVKAQQAKISRAGYREIAKGVSIDIGGRINKCRNEIKELEKGLNVYRFLLAGSSGSAPVSTYIKYINNLIPLWDRAHTIPFTEKVLAFATSIVGRHFDGSSSRSPNTSYIVKSVVKNGGRVVYVSAGNAGVSSDAPAIVPRHIVDALADACDEIWPGDGKSALGKDNSIRKYSHKMGGIVGKYDVNLTRRAATMSLLHERHALPAPYRFRVPFKGRKPLVADSRFVPSSHYEGQGMRLYSLIMTVLKYSAKIYIRGWAIAKLDDDGVLVGFGVGKTPIHASDAAELDETRNLVDYMNLNNKDEG